MKLHKNTLPFPFLMKVKYQNNKSITISRGVVKKNIQPRIVNDAL